MGNYIFLFSFCFGYFVSGQKSDFTKEEAKQNFYNSENRQTLKIPKSDFAVFYKAAKCIKKNYSIQLSEMPIFQIKKTDEFIENGRFRQSLFGLGDTIFPKYHDDGKKTVTCGAFHTSG